MEGYTLGIAGDALSIEGDNLNKKDLLSKIMSGITTIPDNASTVHSIEEGFSQLRMLLGKGEDQSSLLTERLYIDNDTWWGGAKDPFDIRTLMDVLWQLQEIEIDYMKQAGQVTKRKLNPYGLILKDSTWYLVAYCHNVNAIRTFRCERIARVIVKDGHYKIPEGFSLKNYWQQSIKAFANSLSNNKECLVTFEIPVANIDQLPEMDIVWNSRNQGRMVGTTSFESVDAAKVGILPLLTLLKVVKPKEIANYAHKSLADSLDLYREKTKP